MPVSCCVVGCKNRFQKGSGIIFYRFPRTEPRRSLWKAALKRKGWVPSDHQRVCSCHFIEGKASHDKTQPDFVPSLRLEYDSSENTPSKRRYLRATRKSDTKSVERENENDGDNLETILSILKSNLQSLSKNKSSESKVSHQPPETTNQSVTPKKETAPKKKVLIFSEHPCKLVSSLALLWKNGKLCDAGIGNGTSVVVVHKVVLIALSPKLMSTVNVHASHFLMVTVKKSVSYGALMAFAEYMYKGVLDLDPDILSQLRLIALQLEMKELEQLCVDHLDTNSHDTNKTFATNSPTHQQEPECKSLPIIPQLPTKTVSPGSHETAATLTQTLDTKKRHFSHNLRVESPLSPLKKKAVDSDGSSQVSSARFGKHYVSTQGMKTNEQSLLDIKTEPMVFDMETYSQHPLSPSESCAKSSRDFHQPKDYLTSSRAASLEPDQITAPSMSVLLKGTTSNSNGFSLKHFVNANKRFSNNYKMAQPMTTHQSLNDISYITDCEEYIQMPYPVGLFKARGSGMPLEVSSKVDEMTPIQITDIHSMTPTREIWS